MIIRSAFRCLTCEQDHVVRIGMGQDNRQEHRFPCRGCGEEMAIAMEIDYVKISTSVEAIENAVRIEEAPGALVVNVHANFVVDGDDRFTDRTFPHMAQMRAQVQAAQAHGSLVPLPAVGNPVDWPRPFRRPDFADEWKFLKKAWSLHSRGRDSLAAKERMAASEVYYKDEPLNDLPDWVWRFCMFLGATR